MEENLSAARTAPRTPLGELAVLPRPLSWWGQEPHPVIGLSGVRLQLLSVAVHCS